MDGIADNRECAKMGDLESKLRGILKRIEGDGGSLARGAQALAEKIAGSMPAQVCAENGGIARPTTNSVHSLVDRIDWELSRVLRQANDAISRAHATIGQFDPGAMPPSPSVAEPPAGANERWHSQSR